ncbi:MAG: YceI family protein, partial [Pseudobdellovibrio sp.]
NMITGDIRFSLKSLKTGIELRDDHMLNKYLQVQQFSEAKLTIKKIDIPLGWSVTSPVVSQKPFNAVLNLHGVEKEISGFYNVESVNLASIADFEIKLSDFNIEIPSYLGVKVADIVKIKVSFNNMIKTM